jgi:hypothetical protein
MLVEMKLETCQLIEAGRVCADPGFAVEGAQYANSEMTMIRAHILLLPSDGHLSF